MMKPPDEIYPERKAAEFDEAGRPHHARKFRFFTNYSLTSFDYVIYFSFLYRQTKFLSTPSRLCLQNVRK